MSTLTPTDVAASMQERLAAQHARWSDLTSKTFESMMRLVDVGLKATKDTMEESASVAQQMMYASSPQDWLALGAEEGRSNMERLMSLGGDFANITSAMQGELSRAAQAEFTDGWQRMSLLFENFSQGLPDDSKSPYSMMKFAIDKASSGYEQWATMTRQVAEAADSNLSMATGQYAAAKRGGSRTRKGSGHE